MKKILYLACLLAITVLSKDSTVAQTPTHRGLTLCRESKYAESISPLENGKKEELFKNNAGVWHCLALAYLEKNDYKKAQKNAEKAVELEPTNYNFHANLAYVYLLTRKNSKAQSEATKAINLEPGKMNAYYFRGTAYLRDAKFDSAEADASKMLQLDPAYPHGYTLLSTIFLNRLSQKVMGGSAVDQEIKFLKASVDLLKIGKEKTVGKPDHKVVVEAYEEVSVFYDYFTRDKTIFSSMAIPDPGVTPLKIINKPRPGYTNEARSRGIQGTIQIAVLFGANGKVENFLVLQRLGGGLDQEAIKAARKIVFEPKKNNGVAVPVVRMLEYTFSIY